MLLAVPMLAAAQSPGFSDFYQKYAGLSGYTTVEMSGAMFNAINASSSDSSKGESALSDQIDNMVIIVSEEYSAEFLKDVRDMLEKGKYTRFTSVRDGSNLVEFYVLQKNNKAHEFLMFVDDGSSSVVMTITGEDLNVQKISQMASQTTKMLN